MIDPLAVPMFLLGLLMGSIAAEVVLYPEEDRWPR